MANLFPAPPTIATVPSAIEKLRKTFNSGKTRPIAWRKEQLARLKEMVIHNKDTIVHAVQTDLGKKHPFEVIATEINLVIGEIEENLSHIDDWANPDKVYTPIGAQPATSYVHHDPKGVVLVVSPWNYPVNLALVPLAGALTAGNAVFLKLSRHSSSTANTLGQLIPRYLDNDAVVVEYEGGAEMITELIKYKYDHVFFTGSVSVGKIIYEAAARHLTPVTLELGGKNPCIVDRDVNLELAARRIAWGKFFNAGQTCIGVDYVLAVDGIQDQLVEALKKVIQQFYGENPKESDSYARIISAHHTKRLGERLKDGKVVVGGQVDVEQKYIAPTVLTDVNLDSLLMKDEIFGPLLPIIPVASVSDAIAFINERAQPLALYTFTNSSATGDKVLSSTRSGAALINEVLLHFTNGALPFGGCGESGIGSYHGHRTFKVFSHERAVIKSTKTSLLDVPVRYPPYSSTKFFLADTITKTGW